MLTLVPGPSNVEICEVVDGKSVESTVLWHPRRDETLKNEVEDVHSLNTPYLRDRFELSRGQATSIFNALAADEVDVKNQKAYFKVKKHIQNAMYTEMHLDDLMFRVRFDKDKTKHSGHELIIAGTGSGKTYYVVQRILQNLKGPKARRRNFIIFSAEYDADKTLKALKKERFEKYITGVDCGTSAFHESVHTTEEEFFEKEIREKVEEAPPGTVVVFDDARECVSSRQVRQFIDKQLRVGRHAGLSLLVILHSLRSGAWSSQAYSSIRYLTVFPRSQRAKITSFLNKELALPMGEARDHVYAFSQTGRTMMIRYHAPECLIGPKLLRLI